jgi:hypothetical protein
MGRGHRLLTAAAVLLLRLSALQAWPQSSRETAASETWELPPDVRAALAETEDFAFNFDQPGFYAVVALVRDAAQIPGFHEARVLVSDWQDFVDRPSEFRGRPVAIRGIVGRKKDPYSLPTRPDLGQLGQLELHAPRQPIACTVICTSDVTHLPLGARVEVAGYFVMIRQYPGRSNRPQQAALLVTHAPVLLPTGGETASGTALQRWAWFVGAIVLGLLVTVVLLRRGTPPRRDIHSLRASRPAPLHLAADLDAWAADQKENDAGSGNSDQESAGSSDRPVE